MSERLEIQVKRGQNYEIVLENDFSGLAAELEALELKGNSIFIISDSQVAPLYMETVKEALEPLKKTVMDYSFHEGEASKTLETAEEIYQWLIENHCGRNDLIIALGGGVVGDLSGFVAATFLRGIDYIQLPTTLLSMVDSSIGGKTGVDFRGYKNMVGAFKMPRLVYMNLNCLTTLEGRQFFSGFAEAMKSALIKDAIYYEWLIDNMYEICEKDPATLEQLVLGSLKIKKLIVEKDPYEEGDRALLNLGHTIGHAIEKYKNFTLLHGECVSLGCVAAAFISYKKELLTKEEYYEIRDMFVPFYLPISIDSVDMDKIFEYTKSDKKMKNGQIQFILLKKIGKAVIDSSVTDDEIKEGIKEIVFEDEWE